MEIREGNIDIEVIMIRYFAGEASPEEIVQLEKWRGQTEENELYFQEQVRIWNEVEKAKDIVNIDLDEEWAILSKTLDSKIGLVTKRKSFSFVKIAAVISFFIIATVGVYFIMTSGAEERLYASAEPEKFSLPDGSEVTLNVEAILSYSKKFNKKKRSLKLEKGEAFFNVVPSMEKPFVVEVNDIFVRVTGTSFNINTDDDSQVTVIVESGTVEVYRKGKEDESVVLNPGEKVTFNTSLGKIDKTVNKDENFNSWRTKRLVFRDKKLSNVVKKLNKVYNTNIVITNDAISDCRFTSTIDNQSLESVLTLIQSALNLDIKQTEHSIELSGEGC